MDHAETWAGAAVGKLCLVFAAHGAHRPPNSHVASLLRGGRRTGRRPNYFLRCCYIVQPLSVELSGLSAELESLCSHLLLNAELIPWRGNARALHYWHLSCLTHSRLIGRVRWEGTSPMKTPAWVGFLASCSEGVQFALSLHLGVLFKEKRAVACHFYWGHALSSFSGTLDLAFGIFLQVSRLLKR